MNEPESTFGPYLIEGVLGTGGMGEVYRARNTRTDRAVALKLLLAHLAEDEGYRARFLRECRAAGGLSEPHVVPIHDFGDIDGRLYLEMRLVEGTNLGAWLAAHGPPAPEVALAVVTHVAQALDAAHANGLVHRDVKPSNILLAGVSDGTVDAAEVFAYLCDFGVARARDEPGLTSVGAVPGSARYVAPERFDGVEGDPRADVYALACVLHETLTGRPPFDGDFPALMRAHVQDPPPAPSALRPGLAPGLDEVVARGMAKDPDERYPSAGRLAAAARAALAGAPLDPTMPTAPVPAPGTGPGAAPDTSHPGGQHRLAGPGTPRGEQPAVRGPARVPGRADIGPPPRTRPAPSGPRPSVRPGGGSPVSPAPDGRAPVVPVPRGSAAPALLPQAPPARGGLPSALVWTAAAAAVMLIAVTGFVLAGGTTAEDPPGTSPAAQLTDEQKLLRDLPAGFDASGCDTRRGKDPAQTLAVAECTGGLGGTGAGQFARLASTAALEATFVGTATEGGVVKGPDDTVDLCRSGGTTRQQWGDPAMVGGEVGCYVGSEGAHLFWTRTDTRVFCHVIRTDGNAAALYEWWDSLPSIAV